MRIASHVFRDLGLIKDHPYWYASTVRPAGRPAKTTPLTPVLEAAGAEFGVVNGWERATFYKPNPDFKEDHTFRFANWHAVVADEIRTVQERVGIMEVSGFNR